MVLDSRWRVFGGVALFGGALSFPFATGCETFSNCEESRSCAVGGEGGGGGEKATGGDGGAAGSSIVPMAECSRDEDCEALDDGECVGRCVADDADGLARCVAFASDDDDDGHGSAACEAAPGDDCDDGDANSYPGAPALVVAPSALCATEVDGICQDAALSIAWTPHGDPYLARRATLTTVLVQRLDVDGTPEGAVSTWTAPGEIRDSLQLEALDADATFALVWQGYAGTTPGTFGLFVASDLGLEADTALTGNALGMAIYTSGNRGAHNFDLARLGSGWSVYAQNLQSGETLPYVTNGVTSAALIDKDFTHVSSRPSVAVGSTRVVVGLNQLPSAPSYDPRLVVRRFPVTGALATQQGDDIVVVSNGSANDIAPRAAVGTLGDKFVLFYRDAPTGVPLTARTMSEGGTLDVAVVSDSDLMPLDLVELPELGGGILVGVRIREGVYDLYAQRFDGNLQLLGEPVLVLEGLSTLWGTFRATARAARGAVSVFGGGRGEYRLFAANRCE